MFKLENAQSLTGIALILGVCWALSEGRRQFPWRLALGSIGAQAVLIALLFGLPSSRMVLAGAASAVDGLSASTQAGVTFVFGFLAGGDGQPFTVTNPSALFLFGFRVLPVIVVICALSALLWHWRILKWITRGFGIVFQRTMGLRGPPALATAATVFMGQVEGPIFIRAYLPSLSRSELFLLLTVGMSCVAGSTLVAYATILKGVVPAAAAHVLTASLINAPAGVLLARILIPRESAAEVAEDVDLDSTKTYASSIDALMKGTTDGLQIVLAIGATLIVFVALITLADRLLSLLGPVAGSPLSIERGLGLLFSPLAWAMGISWRDAPAAGSLLGVKLVLTEFPAFFNLSKLDPGVFSDRSRLIMTYALCGFGNIASVGINVAGYSVLVPQRREEVMAMVWKALLGGFLASCLTASIVGALPATLFPQS